MKRFLIPSVLVLLAMLGAWYFAPWILNWFGYLPGDFRFDGTYGRVYIPFTSMLLISAVIFLLSHLFTFKDP